ncbi:unnamed protein product [Fraxinus pennsylvanica]|uniref:Glutamate synthase alpha subunit C-terminal domain-containing protein n=1 Tax=Fraxinus pennsylvanica TaxID=56036 RepID=A0AAD2DVM7_9LAMI|nr:unnamed protein product [Fraxinus pennsylvanica]
MWGRYGWSELVVTPIENTLFLPEDATIVGHTCSYGATGGQVFIRGKAGELFSSSGGRHWKSVLLVHDGRMGRNVAAGMTGGSAYILDEDVTLIPKVNKETVKIQRVVASVGQMQLKSRIDAHVEKTRSSKGAAILKEWDKYLPPFWQLVPILRGHRRLRNNRSFVVPSAAVQDLGENVGTRY